MQVFHDCRLTSLWLCIAVACASTPTVAQQQKPNVLFILADNVGYGDIGAYGGASCVARPHHELIGSPRKVSG
jgi:hypothetical protein